MPSIYRISRKGQGPVVDVATVEAIEGAISAGKPSSVHIEEISTDPLPSGRTARRWGTAIKHPDGPVAVEPDPWES